MKESGLTGQYNSLIRRLDYEAAMEWAATGEQVWVSKFEDRLSRSKTYKQLQLYKARTKSTQ